MDNFIIFIAIWFHVLITALSVSGLVLVHTEKIGFSKRIGLMFLFSASLSWVVWSILSISGVLN